MSTQDRGGGEWGKTYRPEWPEEGGTRIKLSSVDRIINGERGCLVARSARRNLRGSGEQGHASGACTVTNQTGRLPSGHSALWVKGHDGERLFHMTR